MVDFAMISLALGAILALPADAAALVPAVQKPSLGPLPGTDPRVLNGTCPSTDKNTTCEAPHPTQLKELHCGDYDTGSRQDLEHDILLRQKWMHHLATDSWPAVSCPVPAQTCRRFACVRTTALYVCNHNSNNITLSCAQEVDAMANKIAGGCCARRGTWASDGISGHYTTDQGWKVVVAHADCRGQLDQDAVVPSNTGIAANGRCEVANDGLGDDDGIPLSRYLAMTGGLYPTVKLRKGQPAIPTALRPEVAWSANRTASANSTAAPQPAASASPGRLNSTTVAAATTATTTTTGPSGFSTIFGIRTGLAPVTSAASPVEDSEAQVTGEAVATDEA